jgi:heme-degrading monooxygenase HmoA
MQTSQQGGQNNGEYLGGTAMYARLTIFRFKIDRIEEGIKLYQESVIPATKTQKGFCQAYLLTDRNTGDGISMTFWETQADALANEENRYYQEQLVKFFPGFYESGPIREGYEVSLQF